MTELTRKTSTAASTIGSRRDVSGTIVASGW